MARRIILSSQVEMTRRLGLALPQQLPIAARRLALASPECFLLDVPAARCLTDS